MAKSQDCSFLPPPRILTCGRFLVFILGLLAFTANSMADIVERYPAGSSTADYTGNDLKDVQTHSGAATGDVIKVSQDITVSTAIGSGYSVGSFTLQGVSSENPVTISGGSRLYNLPNTVKEFTLKDVTVSNFKNTEDYGGAFLLNGNTTVHAENVTFSNNKSCRGGVFGSQNMKLTLYGNNIVFDSNQAAGHSSNYDYGGAIRCGIAIYGETSESVIKFINNSATNCGGAITSNGSEGVFSSGQFIFDNNKSNSSGGAIHANNSLTFSGNGSSATFTNNVAAQNGNDIYIQNQNGLILTFKDAGNYSFDGGIYLENANQKIIIDKAQVAIAGRENDTTNNYVLRSVTISNGGKLTANLDNIDKIENTTITLNGTESQVELYNALLNQVASIKSDTGAGTFDLEYSAANGAVQNESLLISSGRIDVKGYMEGGITVDANGVFSPGNSVGEAKFGGGYELYDGAKLLIEMDETGIDSLIASSFTENNGIIELAIDGIPFGSQYDVITATDGFSGSQDEAYWLGKFGTLPDYLTLSVVDGVYGANSQTVRLSIDRNAVPEPSTWALLLLGAAGLLYVRKRTRK